MFKTNYGDFTPDTWEEACQIAFKSAYKDENYQKMPDANGDLGIEGFTLKTGKVFQCYCPETNITGQELYKAIRGKITSDIKKLEKNCIELKKMLGDKKIKEWYLVTPKNADKNIYPHCRKKEKEILARKLDIINDTFEIIIHEAEDYVTHFKFSEEGIIYSPSVNDDEKKKLISTENEYINNAKRKYTKVYNDDYEDLNQLEQSVLKITDVSIDRYLKGKKSIEFLRVNHPKDYERLNRIIAQMEQEVEIESLGKILHKKQFIKNQTDIVETKLKNELQGFDGIMLRDLAHQVVSRWVLECPLNFI